MSVAATMAFALAERVERTGGPRAGLLAYQPLASTSDADVRAKAILAALRCALVLRERQVVERMIASWPSAGDGVWDAPIAAACKRMMREDFRREAVALAEAEATRRPSAASHYLYARCLDLQGEAADRVLSSFREAVERADSEARVDIALASRVRRIELLSGAWTTLRDALEETRAVDLTRAPPGARLVVARVMLLSPSRFTRATAVGILDGIASGDDPRLARRALADVARWADDMATALTPLEQDRVVALLSRPRALSDAPRMRAIALARGRIIADASRAVVDASELDASLRARVDRARDIAGGRFQSLAAPSFDLRPRSPRDETTARDPSRWERLVDAVLDVAAALRDGAAPRAAGALGALLDVEISGEHLPHQVLPLAYAALLHDDAALREVGARFFEARLRRPRAGAPPTGYLALAEALRMAGKPAAAMLARHAALVSAEPGAVDALGTAMAREGWRYADEGDRDRAIAALRSAKALLEGTTSSSA